jgi:tetraacyldisaccharide 4'-kinase
VLLDEPAWWYEAEPGLPARLLAPASAVYGWVAKARYLRAKGYRSRLPVICAGNFTAGGTGKTPLAIHLIELLSARGERPVVLTRGYGGRLAGPHWVGAADTAEAVGDEALLLARVAPTMVTRDRAAGARAIEAGPHEATVVVMDDGLQNPSLAKDLAIAVVDGRRGLGNGRVIPSGPLRAPLEFMLEVTGAVVVNEREEAGSDVADWLRRRFTGPVLRARTAARGDVGWLEGARVVAWAGIAAPQRFFDMLAGHGAEVAEGVAFRDHQQLDAADAQRLLALARRHGAQLATTEKDMARLTGASGPLAELAAASRVLPIRLALAGADAERLAALIEGALKTRRG